MLHVAMLISAFTVNVTGLWTLTIEDPLNLTYNVPLTLEQDGERLSGLVDNTAPLTGSLRDGRITMSYETDTPNVGRITVYFEGRVDGNEMSGQVTFGRYATGRWSAASDDESR